VILQLLRSRHCWAVTASTTDLLLQLSLLYHPGTDHTENTVPHCYSSIVAVRTRFPCIYSATALAYLLISRICTAVGPRDTLLWRVDPFLGVNREIGDCTAAVARQRPANNIGMVFFARSAKQQLNSNRGTICSVRSLPR
jgi:hypothetical protein